MMIKLLMWSMLLSIGLSDYAKGRQDAWKRGEQSGNTSYRSRYARDSSLEKNYEIVVPRKVRSDGVFISHQIPHHYKRSFYEGKKRDELTPEDALHYRLSIDGEEYHLELYPNHRLVGPGAVVEERKAPARASTRDTGNYDFIDDTKFRKLRDTQCHYHGRVRDQRDVTALSTCYGLAGYIRTKRYLYTIEPIENYSPNAEAEHPHIVYRRGQCVPGEEPTLLCSTTVYPSGRFAKDSRDLAKRNPRKIEDRAYTIELLAVLDKSFLDGHRDPDVENYVLTLFNMAAGLFRDRSLGVEMELVIVRIIRLEVEEDEMNLSVNKNIESTLKHFQEWQKKMNPGDDAHPNHHDCAVLIMKTDICISQDLCSFTGTSTISGTCDPLRGAVVVKDDGLHTGYGIAHHLGHTIGMAHDGKDENDCQGIISHQAGYVETTVMYPGYHYVTRGWSKCSRNYVKLYIEAGLATCLLDEAEDHHFPSVELLPGVMYGGDDQCRLRFRQDARQCDLGITCDTLKCAVPDMGCVFTKRPPADGTSCGEKKWCYGMRCLMIGERPSAVDGGWNSWSAWSHCSRTCGSGIAIARRKCNNPRPSKGGRDCHGHSKRHKICASNPCEAGAPSFRDVQCSEFNDWIFPEDGKVHHWVGYNLPENLKASENPCVLYCLSETKLLTSLRTKVVDGTTCYRGIRDICVGGVCREIPCDLDMESNAIEDMCGVCRGDSTSCVLKEGVLNIAEQQKLKKVLDIPAGAKNIRVEESQPTKSRIVLRSKKTKNILIDGNRLGLFDVPGSKAWLGMIRAKQEALNIPGPVAEDLVVLIYPRENVTLKYSLGLEPDEPRKPSFEWSFIEWARCSAPCGPGEQVSKPSCVEKIGGQVDEKFCKNIIKPEVKVRACNQAPCIPRWMIGDWQGCEPCTPNCKKFRVVKCVQPIGHGEQEENVIADGYCQGPKPKESASEACRAIRGSEEAPTEHRDTLENQVEVVQPAERLDTTLGTKSASRLLSKRSKTGGMAFNKRLTKMTLAGEKKLSRRIHRMPETNGLDFSRLKLTERSGKAKDSDMKSEAFVRKRMGVKREKADVAMKGQVILDKEDVKNLTLTIVLERNDANAVINFPKDFQPQPPENATEFILTGMDAVKYIERIQQGAKTSSGSL